MPRRHQKPPRDNPPMQKAKGRRLVPRSLRSAPKGPQRLPPKMNGRWAILRHDPYGKFSNAAFSIKLPGLLRHSTSVSRFQDGSTSVTTGTRSMKFRRSSSTSKGPRTGHDSRSSGRRCSCREVPRGYRHRRVRPQLSRCDRDMGHFKRTEWRSPRTARHRLEAYPGGRSERVGLVLRRAPREHRELKA